QRQERKEKLTSARDECKKYMEEHPNKLSYTTTFDEFKEALRKEEFFKNLTSKDKEKLFNEVIGPLKKEHKESKFFFFWNFASIANLAVQRRPRGKKKRKRNF